MLSGMNENKSKLEVASTKRSMKSIAEVVQQVANVCRVPSTEDHFHRFQFFFKISFLNEKFCRFAGKTSSTSSPLLISIEILSEDGSAELSVNCEKMVIGLIH